MTNNLFDELDKADDEALLAAGWARSETYGPGQWISPDRKTLTHRAKALEIMRQSQKEPKNV